MTIRFDLTHCFADDQREIIRDILQRRDEREYYRKRKLEFEEFTPAPEFTPMPYEVPDYQRCQKKVSLLSIFRNILSI